MRRSKLYILYIGICLGLWAYLPACGAQDRKAASFVVVIDAGHGGNDPGAVGRISKEKNINLKVALKLGGLIGKQCPDVKVVYTRTRDVFIPLGRRAEIANAAKADLFLSIHTNALPGNRKFKGASTWTLGLAKSDANLEVAKRENAVILYEADYQTRYAGFDPKSSESYIIFELMQDKHMSQSVHLASLIQQELKRTGNHIDRGVHQAGFLVLKESAMPSVLVELGFISSPEEERFMNTDQGVASLAGGIYRAFLTYKREQEARHKATATDASPVSPGQDKAGDTPSAEADALVFKVQILASTRPLPADDPQLKGLTDVECYQEGKYYKYTCGSSADYRKMERLRQRLRTRFKDAFIVAFKQGKKTDIHAAIREFENKNTNQ